MVQAKQRLSTGGRHGKAGSGSGPTPFGPKAPGVENARLFAVLALSALVAVGLVVGSAEFPGREQSLGDDPGGHSGEFMALSAAVIRAAEDAGLEPRSVELDGDLASFTYHARAQHVDSPGGRSGQVWVQLSTETPPHLESARPVRLDSQYALGAELPSGLIALRCGPLWVRTTGPGAGGSSFAEIEDLLRAVDCSATGDAAD